MFLLFHTQYIQGIQVQSNTLISEVRIISLSSIYIYCMGRQWTLKLCITYCFVKCNAVSSCTLEVKWHIFSMKCHPEDPCRWRPHGPLKCWYWTTTLHGITTQKTTWIFAAAKASNPALNFLVNAIFICYCCSQILELYHIFKQFISSQ